MKEMFYQSSSEKGLTLIEVLASIVILSIVVMSFLTAFAQTSRTNYTSKNIIDATYIAENSMEEVRNFVTSSSSPASLNNLTIKDPGSTTSLYTNKIGTSTYMKMANGHYVEVKLSPGKDTSMVKVLVRVFNNNTTSKKQEAQMEVLLSWNQQ